MTHHIGVNDHYRWETSAGQFRAAAFLADLGVKKVRVDLHWNWFESSGPNTWDDPATSRLDNYMALCRQNGIDVLFVVLGAPNWAALNGKGGDGAGIDAKHFGDFAAWVRRVVDRWQPEAVEILNEPNLGQFWSGANYNGGILGNYPGTSSLAGTYAKVLAAVRASLAGSPVTVVGGCSFTAQWEDWRCQTYLGWLKSSGALALMDVLSIHEYPMHIVQKYPVTVDQVPWSGSSPARASILGMVADVLPRIGWTGPVWVTEAGFNTVPGDSNGVTEATQAAKVTALGTSLALGQWPAQIDRVYWYTLMDGKASLNGNGEYNWGLVDLTNEDYANLSGTRLKPSYDAFKAIVKSDAPTAPVFVERRSGLVRRQGNRRKSDRRTGPTDRRQG